MNGLKSESHYALAAVACLGRANGFLPLRAISARTRTPAPFLAKILLKLRRANILVARHGRAGGYSLARPVDQISVSEVLEACSGDRLAFDVECDAVSSTPGLPQGLERLNRQLSGILESVTIAQLLFQSESVAVAPRVELASAVG